MSKFSPYIRIAEDVAIVAGTAAASLAAGGTPQDIVESVAAAPLIRSFIATVLSGGRSSGVLEALGLIHQALPLLQVIQPKLLSPKAAAEIEKVDAAVQADVSDIAAPVTPALPVVA